MSTINIGYGNTGEILKTANGYSVELYCSSCELSNEIISNIIENWGDYYSVHNIVPNVDIYFDGDEEYLYFEDTDGCSCKFDLDSFKNTFKI